MKPITNMRHSALRLGHEGSVITWIKIDCEGCEYSLIPKLHVVNARFNQIFIEVHGIDVVRIIELFEHLRHAGFIVFHKERNNWGCDGYRCVEFSLMTIEYARSVLQNYVSA